jgi:hypothetical protein
MVSRRSLLLGGLALLQAVAAHGETLSPLSPPAGSIVLTVTGAIERTNGPRGAEFDIGMLERLGLQSMTTRTPWTEGEVHFEGVSARKLMATVGAAGTEVEALALNDFSSIIPVTDFDTYDVLLAMRMNGEPLRVRDKGPLWIVYPWSDHPQLDDFATREKSVWQLSLLRVR